MSKSIDSTTSFTVQWFCESGNVTSSFECQKGVGFFATQTLLQGEHQAKCGCLDGLQKTRIRNAAVATDEWWAELTKNATRRGIAGK